MSPSPEIAIRPARMDDLAAIFHPVILGPGQLAKAHTRDEYVAFEQVAAAAEIYARLLKVAAGMRST